ncbi:hapless 2-like isoform X2 [Centruroides sculpturatus]|uniref:hapless 2-like isoform X2 n=1 Tax=Centruroides sculpturatus TaxID=218467 RepID=UPI000C6CAB27|nr:hapless 2-like isoform X2 [Centruroides sculpturatus]
MIGLFCFSLFYTSNCRAFEVKMTANVIRCQPPPTSNQFALWPCHKKLGLDVRLDDNLKFGEEEERVMIDAVYDAEDGVDRRLADTLVFVLRQEKSQLIYPLHYLWSANAKAEEEVFNQETFQNYTGCHVTELVESPCRSLHWGGKWDPFRRSGRQVRGKQDCGRIDSSSTHCLRYNRVWYLVTSLGQPEIRRAVYLDIYARTETSAGSTVWRRVIDGQLSVGSRTTRRKEKSLTVEYFPPSPPEDALRLDNRRLLIPAPSPELGAEDIPPLFQDGADDYLLVPESSLDESGTSCDKIGVSYEAFYRQKNKCLKARGSCLKNQPLDLWTRDRAKLRAGLKGDYLLRFYAQPSRRPLLVDGARRRHWLALEMSGNSSARLRLEMNAANVSVLSPGRRAQISFVVTKYFGRVPIIVALVTNTGLAPASFSVSATDCSSRTSSVSVSPQSSRSVVLDLSLDSARISEFSCSVEVRSVRSGRTVASREALFRRGRYCSCYQYCRCSCGDDGFRCRSISQKAFASSGFRGSLPVTAGRPTPHFAIRLRMASAVIVVFLVLGLAKEIVRLTLWPAAGHFGIKSCLFGRRKIARYWEPELREARVVFEDGHPVHPDTRERVRTISYRAESALNLLFFFVWPFLLLHSIYVTVVGWRRDRKAYSEERPEYREEKLYLRQRFSDGEKLANSLSMRSYVEAKARVERMAKELSTSIR